MRTTVLLALAFASLCSSCAPRSAGNTGVITYVVERPAHPHANNPIPSYPAALLATRDSGQVVLAFVVTKAGTVDTTTIEVVRSDHSLFEAAARAVLPSWRFYPAEIGGTPPSGCSTDAEGRHVCARRGKPGVRVDQRVEVPFSFKPPPA